jgi:DNA-binding response OmpR family regulator
LRGGRRIEILALVRASAGLVLVVEDNADLRVAVRETLREQGWEVALAESAGEAYDVLAQDDPQAVVLDWVLPGGEGGVRAVRRVRELAPATRIVMFTGLADARDQRSALEAGADAFVPKAGGLTALAETLARVAGDRSGAGEAS